jgi:hypothetical protein
MRMNCGMMVLVACVLAGCSAQTFDMPYPIAVGKLTDLYPEVDTGGEYDFGLLETVPAYSDEGGASPRSVVVRHMDVSEGRAYRITIEKDWKFISPRLTTFTVTSVGDTRVKVDVRSDRKVGLASMRDSGYEAARMAEVRQALKLPDNAMFEN